MSCVILVAKKKCPGKQRENKVQEKDLAHSHMLAGEITKVGLFPIVYLCKLGKKICVGCVWVVWAFFFEKYLVGMCDACDVERVEVGNRRV